jgi:hypothetical protein
MRGLETTTKCHGCLLAPLGAELAAARQLFIISLGTFLSEKSLTVLLHRRFSSRARERFNISSFWNSLYADNGIRLISLILFLDFLSQIIRI